MTEYIFKKGFYWPERARKKDIDYSLRHMKSLDYVLRIARWDTRREVVVQAGGSYGMWPDKLANKYGLVITFEPEFESFECLCKNCYDKYNVVKMQCALSSECRLLRIATKSFASHEVGFGEKGRIVTAITIDSLNLPKCDAIMLDVESHNFEALLGAKDTIKKFRPIVLIESPRDITKNKPVQYLKALNYKPIRHIHNDWILEPE